RSGSLASDQRRLTRDPAAPSPSPSGLSCALSRPYGCCRTGDKHMARAWHLKSRPTGMPTLENFELKDVELPPLADREVRVQNLWLSVDPYMRGRMNDVK